MMRTLLAVHEQRISEHETGITRAAEKQYRYAIDCFGRYLGHVPSLEDLTPATFNSYIDRLRESGLASATIKLKYRHIKTLWRFAAEEGWIDQPRKLRKVRIEHRDPVAWTHADVCRLVSVALALDPWPPYPQRFFADLQKVRNEPDRVEAMRGCGWCSGVSGRKITATMLDAMLERMDAGIPETCKDDYPISKSIFFASFIAMAWDTGLRIGDIFRIRRSDIKRNADGTARLRIVQSKTRYPIECFVNAATLQLIDRVLLCGDAGRELIWPPRKQRHWFYWHLRLLVVEAGLPFGTSKYIRRGAGSAAEALRFGAGTLLLGHRSRDITVKHYLDPTIVQHELLQLPGVAT